MHTSVFLTEAVEALAVAPGKHYIDATFGEGGHSRLILAQGGIVLGIDADPVQAGKEKSLHVVAGNFADIQSIAEREGFTDVDGILFDFGLSMVQLSSGGRGLSYKNDEEPLDMRLGTTGMSAAEYLNQVLDEQLVEDLTRYSEDLKAEQIAHAIIRYRKQKPIETVKDLKLCIDRAIRHTGSTVTYARIFQAIRIIVNDELEVIKKGLHQAFQLVKPGGTIVVISFHSLEDRIVKIFVRGLGAAAKHERLEVHKKRCVQKFERSATLRVITKV